VKKEVQNLKSTVTSAAEPVTQAKTEIAQSISKDKDDFAKYFGEIGNKVAEPEKPPSAPVAPPS
jgi:hypothetical protein